MLSQQQWVVLLPLLQLVLAAAVEPVAPAPAGSSSRDPQRELRVAGPWPWRQGLKPGLHQTAAQLVAPHCLAQTRGCGL